MEVKERTNKHGVWMTEFFIGGKLKGRLFRTSQSTMPFEVFTEPAVKSLRCDTIGEAEKWLLSILAVHETKD